jgi:hypothetical protein
MGDSNNDNSIPPRVRAAMDLLQYTRQITEQYDVSLPARQLTPLERSVEAAALRAVQQYLLGEMDFREPRRRKKKRQAEIEPNASTA